MNVKTEQSGNVSIVRVDEPRLMYPILADFSSAVTGLVAAGRRDILIDLSPVTYIDSASLGVLVAHYKRAIEKEAIIKLLKPNEKTLSILVMTRLNLVFEIFEDEPTALASF